MKVSDYIDLWRVSQRRRQSEEDYREFQAFQARQLLGYLSDKGLTIEGKRLLDLGSGIAGYSREFARRGARVIGADLIQPNQTPVEHLSLLQANAMAVPLQSESVDVIFCASLIEHVAKPQEVLVEIERLLKWGGVSYVSFPPYYSPMGGHEYAPFHYLGERLAMRLVHRRTLVPDWVRQLYSVPEESNSFSDLYEGWGLYKMTIRKFRRLLSNTGLACLNISTRYLPISFVRWPVIGEALTWHVQFLLSKRRTTAGDPS